MTMHNMHEGPWLKRLRIRCFGLTARERAENLATLARIRAEVAAEAARQDAEDEALLERVRGCALCYGDRWISDSLQDYERCTDGDEQARFRQRAGLLGGAAEGRMACPRCQPDWAPGGA